MRQCSYSNLSNVIFEDSSQIGRCDERCKLTLNKNYIKKLLCGYKQIDVNSFLFVKGTVVWKVHSRFLLILQFYITRADLSSSAGNNFFPVPMEVGIKTTAWLTFLASIFSSERMAKTGGGGELSPSAPLSLQTSLPFDCLIRVSHWPPFFNIDSRKRKKEVLFSFSLMLKENVVKVFLAFLQHMKNGKNSGI